MTTTITYDTLPDSWTRHARCERWALYTEEHGDLIAVRVTNGPNRWELDDAMRDACGALQEDLATGRPIPLARRAWYFMLQGWLVTPAAGLPDIAAAMMRAGSLHRLQVRAISATCTHEEGTSR